jgi:hypothetical protein
MISKLTEDLTPKTNTPKSMLDQLSINSNKEKMVVEEFNNLEGEKTRLNLESNNNSHDHLE